MSEFAKKNDLVPPCGVPVFSDDLAMDLRIMCEPLESDARKWYSLARVLGQMSEQLGVELHDEDEPESDEPESPFSMDVALDEIWLKALKKRGLALSEPTLVADSYIIHDMVCFRKSDYTLCDSGVSIDEYHGMPEIGENAVRTTVSEINE